MQSVGIRKLKQSASEILRRVRERGEAYEITSYGKVIARLVPASPQKARSLGQAWSDLDTLAAEIGVRWPKKLSAVKAVSEQRRQL